MTSLEELLDLAEAQARRVLIGTKEELTPMWLMVDAENRVQVVATPWRDNREKHLTVRVMRLSMREQQIVAYTLLVEAWFAVASAKEMGGKEYKGPPPSERADRKEAVCVIGCNRAGQSLFRQWEIVRDKRGRCAELRRLNAPDDKVTSAIFDNLLQPEGRPN